MPGGFYTPNAGDVIAAANWITYVRNQTLNYFASTAARTSAISSPVEGMISYLSDVKRIDVYDGSAWQPVAFVPDFVMARRTSDSSGVTSNTTLADDTQLQLTVGVANAIYMVTSHIIYTASTAGDLKIGWTGPAGATFNWNLNGPASTIAGGAGDVYFGQNSISGSDIAGGAGTGSAIVAHPTGLLAISSTTGTFKMQWAQGTSDGGATTVRADSHILLRRIV